MSEGFLKLIRHRMERSNEISGDFVPWEMDDKYNAYQFVQSMGWKTPRYEKCSSAAEALIAGKSLGKQFVVKQPNLHSSQGVWVLEDIGSGKYLDLLRLNIATIGDIKPSGPTPAYWLAEEFVTPAYQASHSIPLDYKVYAFNGHVTHVLQIDRNVRPYRVALFDGTFLPLRGGHHYRLNPNVYRQQGHIIPSAAPHILAMAADLSRTLNTKFVRVDCFDGKDGVVFGEFTFTPGSEDVGTISYPQPILSLLDDAVNGEKIASLCGLNIAIDELYRDAKKHHGPLFIGDDSLLSLITSGAAHQDLRYGGNLAKHFLSDPIGIHFSLASRMVGLINGDLEQAFHIYSAIQQSSGYIEGPAMMDEFARIARNYHAALTAYSPWHKVRVAELDLADGMTRDLSEITKLAESGYIPAKNLLQRIAPPSKH